MKTIPGKLSISRPSGEDNPCIHITLEDASAHVRVVEISVPYETFALVLTGLSLQPVTFDFNDSGLVGTIAETKTERVPFPGFTLRDDGDAANKALAPFEVDGWRAYRNDLFNHHRRNGDCQSVSFKRYLRDGKPVELP